MPRTAHNILIYNSQHFEGIGLGQRNAADLAKAGYPVIACGVGSPTMPPSPLVRATHAQKAYEQDSYGYIEIEGFHDVRRTIARAVNSIDKLGSHFKSKDVVITHGAGSAYYTLMQHFGKLSAQSGFLTYPYYPYHRKAQRLTNSEGGIIKGTLHNDFIPTLEEMRAAIVEKPGPVILTLVYPNNPTGVALDETQAKQLAESINQVVKERYQKQQKRSDFYMVIEEVYFPIIDPETKVNSIYTYLSPEARKNCFVTVSASKGVGAANLRVGAILSKNNQVLSQVIDPIETHAMAVSPPAAYAFAAGLEEIADDLERAQKNLWDYYGVNRIQLMANGLERIRESVEPHCLENAEPVRIMPRGGMFLFADLSFLKGKQVPEALQPLLGGKTEIRTDADITNIAVAMCELGYTSVALAPAQAFGWPEGDCMVRISCVEDPRLLNIALESLQAMTNLICGKDAGIDSNTERAKQIIKEVRSERQKHIIPAQSR